MAASEEQLSPTDDARSNLERTAPEIVAKIVHELGGSPRPWPTRVLRDNGITSSAELGELLEASPKRIRDSYFRALGGHPSTSKRMTFRMLEGYYPDWPGLFLDALEKQSLAGETAKISVACRALDEMGVPVKPGWIYSRMSPASRYYDEEFALEVSGATSAIMGRIQEKLEHELSEQDGLAGTRLAYLRAHPHSPIGKTAQQLEVKTTHHAIQESRLRVTAELVEESRGLLERAKEKAGVIDVTDEGTDVRRSGADNRGAARRGRGGKAKAAQAQAGQAG